MEDAEEREFQRLRGAWGSLVPAGAATLFEGYPPGATPAVLERDAAIGPHAPLTRALEFGTQEKSVRAG